MATKKKENLSLRIELDLRDPLEAKIADIWRTGVEVALGVDVSGKQLFRHAMARLIEERSKPKRDEVFGNVERIEEKEKKIEGVSAKSEKHLGDWV